MYKKVFLNKIFSAFRHYSNHKQPVYRFQGGWQTTGAQVRPADTRTPAQIDATIEALAEKIPEVAQFKKQIRTMNPQHRALVADTIELASTEDPIRMLDKITKDGRSILEVLLPKFIKASKENPGALKLTQSVINNTDTQTSKYFLSIVAGFNPLAILSRNEAVRRYAMMQAKGKGLKTTEDYLTFINQKIAEEQSSHPIEYFTETIIDRPELNELMEASSEIVKPIAESTINGPYSGTLERQFNFVKTIGTLFKH